MQSLLYLFTSQFTSPVATFTWAFDGKRKNLRFCCFVREDILIKHKDNHKENSSTRDFLVEVITATWRNAMKEDQE